MKARSLSLFAVLVLFLCAGAWAQAANGAAPSQSRGIDPSLLARAKAGDAEAEFRLSFRYFDLGDQTKACHWVRMAAKNGDAVAQATLAGFYEAGSNRSELCTVARNSTQAAYWYRKAADQGEAGAQYQLGLDYALGVGVPQNSAQATVWFLKAAKRGNAEAQCVLFYNYTYGIGVPQDPAQAAMWLLKADKQGDADARDILAGSDAQDIVGRAFETGEGVPQDYAQAAAWYHKAAEQGDTLAQWSLGSLYESGRGVSKDYAEAYFWLDLAAADKPMGVTQEEIDKIRDDAASHLPPAELNTVQERARKWFEDHPRQSP